MALDLTETPTQNDHSSTATVRFNGKLTADPSKTETGKAIQLTYVTDKGANSKAYIAVSHVLKSSDLKTLVQTAREGDDIILTFSKTPEGKIDQLKTVVKGRLEKAPNNSFKAGTFTGTKKTPYVDNTVGMIKGNAVTNAVNLAIADQDLTELNLRKNLLKVLNLHGYAESLDIKKEMHGGKGNKVITEEADDLLSGITRDVM